MMQSVSGVIYPIKSLTKSIRLNPKLIRSTASRQDKATNERNRMKSVLLKNTTAWFGSDTKFLSHQGIVPFEKPDTREEQEQNSTLLRGVKMD
jgi:hypothetical protein